MVDMEPAVAVAILSFEPTFGLDFPDLVACRKVVA